MSLKISNKLKLSLFLSAASFAMLPAQAVYANGCTPNQTGTAGNDTITCTGAQVVNSGNVRAGAGNDTIIVDNANSAGVKLGFRWW